MTRGAVMYFSIFNREYVTNAHTITQTHKIEQFKKDMISLHRIGYKNYLKLM